MRGEHGNLESEFGLMSRNPTFSPERLRSRLAQLEQELNSIATYLDRNLTRELVVYIPVVYELEEAVEAVARAKKLVDENLRRLT